MTSLDVLKMLVEMRDQGLTLLALIAGGVWMLVILRAVEMFKSK
jgi:hypothetical protein